MMCDEWLFVTSDTTFKMLAMSYEMDLRNDPRLMVDEYHLVSNPKECCDIFEELPITEQERIAIQWVIDMPDDYQNEWEDFLDAN